MHGAFDVDCCTCWASSFYLTLENSHRTRVEFWLVCRVVLKLKLIKRKSGIQSQSSEGRGSDRKIWYISKAMKSNERVRFLHAAHRPCPGSQRRQYEFELISPALCHPAGVLLMVKAPLIRRHGAGSSGPSVTQQIWLSEAASNLSQLKKQKPRCHNNKSGMENEAF